MIYLLNRNNALLNGVVAVSILSEQEVAFDNAHLPSLSEVIEK